MSLASAREAVEMAAMAAMLWCGVEQRKKEKEKGMKDV